MISLANRRIRRQIALGQYRAWQLTRLTTPRSQGVSRTQARLAGLYWARKIRPYLLPNGSIPDA